MSEKRLPIVVGYDGTGGSLAATHWAIIEARSKHLPVRLVTAYQLDPDYPWLLAYNGAGDDREARNSYRELVSTQVHHLHRTATDVVVEGRAVEGDPADVLCRQSAAAHLLVVGHRSRRGVGGVMLGSVAADVVAKSHSPVMVLRDLPPAHHGGVVAGVDGGPTSHTVLEFAFDYASRHQLPLTAALCLPPTAQRLGGGEHAAIDQARRWLSETAAGWREKYPDVPVQHTVIADQPVDGLTDLAIGQRLLVVGINRTRHRIGAALGSVANGLLHHAPCAVVVVPTATPGRP